MRFFRDLAGVLFVVIGLAVVPAYAAQGGEGDNTGCNGQGNPNSPCQGNGGAGGAGGAGGDGGTGIGIGVGVAKQHQHQHQTQTSVNVNDNRSSARSSSKASVKDSANNQNTVTVEGDRTEIPAQAPAVFSPNLTASPEACMGSTSVGGSAGFASISLGISVGSTWKNHDCELRAFSREIGSLGPTFTPVRIALLSQNDDVKKAFQDAGVEIPTPKKAAAMIQPPTAAAYAPAPFAVQGGVQIEKRNVSPEPAQIVCRDGELRVKAGNGEYFCRAR